MEEAKTPLVVVIRDPDYSNEYHVFGGEVRYYDIDCGYADLSDHDEYADWAEGHLSGANDLEQEGYEEAATFIRNVVNDYTPDDYEPAREAADD